jgi:hypothetical protein
VLALASLPFFFFSSLLLFSSRISDKLREEKK